MNSRKLPANSLNHTYKEVVAEKLYLFSSGNFLFRRSSAEWPQHSWRPNSVCSLCGGTESG